MAMAVRTGAERLAGEPGLVADGRLGLITNFTGVLPDLRPTAVALLESGLRLTALFGPEHGLRGTAQAGASEAEGNDPDTGLPVFDTYLRHGLAVGELALQLGEATVIPMEGWSRSLPSGLPWVPPSPNMPTIDTALVYPGTGLFEGTNLSEGRGTTRPFETIGAPYVDDRLVPALRSCDLPGLIFRRTWFEPVFSKYAGQAVSGVQLHVVDRSAFEPVRTALVMLRVLNELYPDDFGLLPSLDKLWGSDSLRKALESGHDPVALLPEATTPAGWVRPGVLLYEGTA
ncbi:exo-beta-N-acetylmuramidase NamZ family protein [Kribbella sp. NBC_00359]|uniref:exo-beta-N-acetylmuramidase NamZ family protein n=1 Tax=Kribbella sp. NBC_00359 TaxID=2975966 RepID=UPI002E2331EC